MATAAKEKSMFKSAPTQNPDEFATGFPDKFNGVIDLILSYPYVGKQSATGKHFLWVGVRMTPDEDSGYEEFTEKYFAGYLNKGVPSKDDETPAGGDDQFYIALSKGEESLDKPCIGDDGHVIKDHPNVGRYIIGQPDKKLNWHQFLVALREADEKGLIDWNLPQYDLARFQGLKCRFDRVPQEDSGRGPKKEGDKSFLVLVPTTVYGFEKTAKGTGASASSSKKATTAQKEESSDSSLGDRIVPEILKALGAAKGNKLLKGELMAKVAKAFDKSERGEAYGWFDNDEHLKKIDGVDAIVDTDDKGNEFVHALELA